MEDTADSTRVCSNCKKAVSVSNLQMHELHCKRFMTVCEKCGEVVNKADVKAHEEEFHCDVKCEQCGVTVTKDRLMQHMAVECSRCPVLCTYCELEYPLCDLNTHDEECGSRTDLCRVCGDLVMLRNMKDHLESDCTRHVTTACSSGSVRPSGTGYDLLSLGEDQQSESPHYAHFLPKIQNRDAELQSLQSLSGRAPKSTVATSLPPINDLPLVGGRLRSQDDGDWEVDMLPCEFCNSLCSKDDFEYHQAICAGALDLDREPPDYFIDKQLTNHSPPESLAGAFIVPTTFADVVCVPCEFCEMPIPVDELAAHQFGCEVRFPHEMTDYSPQLSQECGHDDLGGGDVGVFGMGFHMPIAPPSAPHSARRSQNCFTTYRNGRAQSDDISSAFKSMTVTGLPRYFGGVPHISPRVQASNDPIITFPDELFPCEFCQLEFPCDLLMQHQYSCDMNTTRVITPMPEIMELPDGASEPTVRTEPHASPFKPRSKKNVPK